MNVATFIDGKKQRSRSQNNNQTNYSQIYNSGSIHIGQKSILPTQTQILNKTYQNLQNAYGETVTKVKDDKQGKIKESGIIINDNSIQNLKGRKKSRNNNQLPNRDYTGQSFSSSQNPMYHNNSLTGLLSQEGSIMTIQQQNFLLTQ